jgi:hypothetical protein
MQILQGGVSHGLVAMYRSPRPQRAISPANSAYAPYANSRENWLRAKSNLNLEELSFVRSVGFQTL